MVEPIVYTLRTLTSIYSNRRLWEYCMDHLSEDMEAHLHLIHTASLGCLLLAAEKRDKLPADRKELLEGILADAALQRSLDNFLQDALIRREPAALLECLGHHHATLELAGASLDRLFDEGTPPSGEGSSPGIEEIGGEPGIARTSTVISNAVRIPETML